MKHLPSHSRNSLSLFGHTAPEHIVMGSGTFDHEAQVVDIDRAQGSTTRYDKPAPALLHG